MYRASVGGGAASSTRYRHPLIAALIDLIGDGASRRSARRGGWSGRRLALCAVLMAWTAAPTLGDRFEAARELAGVRRARTYQGFVKALGRCGTALVDRIRRQLMFTIHQCAGPAWCIGGWCVFAVDGSKFDAPRTDDNIEAFGIAAHENSRPQMLAVVLIHLGTGLLWNWRLDRARGCERSQLRRMVHSTPRGSLIVADAGLVGFDCLSEVVARGRHVLVRLAGNSTLVQGLTGRRDVLSLWPRGVQATRPPLHLRVIRVKLSGGGQVLLGTDVLEGTRLSRQLMLELYRMRWGVEVCYRSLKQTMERRKMRSCSPRRAMLELHWTLVGLMALGVLTWRRVRRRRWSVATSLRAIRGSLLAHTPRRAGRYLSQLRHAILGDNTRRCKSAKGWPNKKNPRPPKPPRLRIATPKEHERYACFDLRKT